jgi:hypothetical protein
MLLVRSCCYLLHKAFRLYCLNHAQGLTECANIIRGYGGEICEDYSDKWDSLNPYRC